MFCYRLYDATTPNRRLVAATAQHWNLHQLRSCRFMIVALQGGARGVMVIVVGNGLGDSSSNPGRDWLHFI